LELNTINQDLHVVLVPIKRNLVELWYFRVRSYLSGITVKGSDLWSWGLTGSGGLQNRGGETSLGSLGKINPEEVDLLPWLVLIHPKNSQELIGVKGFSVNFPFELTI
jgi:hypothetical protein